MFNRYALSYSNKVHNYALYTVYNSTLGPDNSTEYKNNRMYFNLPSQPACT